VGLDPIARTDVWEFITDLRAAADMTVLMTTHYMDEADTYCDRIALMHRGRIRAEGTPANLKAALQPTLGPDVTLDDVFRHHTGGTLDNEPGGIRNVRRARRTARRLG
jgi:ABC-2 type transport system ATP-binding protein